VRVNTRARFVERTLAPRALTRAHNRVELASLMANDDEYTKKYMDGEQARYVDKVRMPAWFNALLLGAGVAGTVAAAVGGGSIFAPVLVFGAVGGAWSILSTLRTVVTRDGVHIQYGLFGPKIPIADIVSVDVVEYEAVKYGGWGIRFGLDGSRAYSLPGKGGRAVRIRRRARGGERVVDITSENPEALRLAIEEVRHSDLAELRERHGVAAAPDASAEAATHEHEHKEERER
jgi:hypothetical protein